jgi:hypothetical protein
VSITVSCGRIGAQPVEIEGVAGDNRVESVDVQKILEFDESSCGKGLVSAPPDR